MSDVNPRRDATERTDAPESMERRHDSREALASDRLREADALLAERERITSAAERLRAIPALRPEAWQHLNRTEREWAVRHGCRELTETFKYPAPEMLFTDLPETQTTVRLGDYSDEDFRVRINEKLLDRPSPADVLEVVCHEYRHAYQHEMAGREMGGLLRDTVPDHSAARIWADNLRPGAYRTPERGIRDYHDQTVERDSRAFAAAIRSRLYPHG
jgi:hypothetical protein